MIQQKMTKQQKTREEILAEDECFRVLEQKLGYRSRYEYLDTSFGTSSRESASAFFRFSGTIGAIFCAVIGLSYACGSPRHRVIETTWEQLNSQPAIVCQEEAPCDELPRIIQHNRQVIDSVAERTGVEASHLEALMAASYLNPHRRAKMAEGYRGTILMHPEKTGVSGSTLDNNLEQDLYSAALEYRAILDDSEFPEEAVGRFFAGEREVKSAVWEAIDSESLCNPEHFNRYPRNHKKGGCVILEAHFEYEETYDELTRRIETGERLGTYDLRVLRRHQNSLPVLRPEDVEGYREVARAMTWYNNLSEPYSQEAVPLFFAYLHAGIARQDETVDRLEGE
ncbi:hypothetical protein KY359_04150 [Candidatus Woesearchaeota archaeon]|nr:hypothetical protein [Candidatus Woesearchaeota archaeon]